MATFRDRIFASVRIAQHSAANITFATLAPGAEVAPHSHRDGYVVLPLAAASLERRTHKQDGTIEREAFDHLPMVPYYVDATKPNEPISIVNNGRTFSTFQKIILHPPICNEPQPELATERLTIVGHDGRRHHFTAEVAGTYIEQAMGLMFRPALQPHHGMLFAWWPAREVSMWMRNVIMPLDILFIGPDGSISSFYRNAQPGSNTPIPSDGMVIATLEVPAGTIDNLRIEKGDQVEGLVL